MLIYLLRHGLTEYNAQKRYQGQRDIPLSPEGAAQLRRADFDPDVVYVSTLQRTSQTARILFPEAKLVPVDGLKEMCFGSFEGHTFHDIEAESPEQALRWRIIGCDLATRLAGVVATRFGGNAGSLLGRRCGCDASRGSSCCCVAA